VRLEDSSPVWYLAYASNLSAERFRYYLAGGRPPGAARSYEGCRDPSPPREARPLWLPGGLSFGGRSRVWGGAMAFYDPAAAGRVAARAYLLTYAQFSDVVAQESRRPLGTPLVLGSQPDGRHPGLSDIYDIVLRLDSADCVPRLTLTSGRLPPPAAPSSAYLRTILAGLSSGFGLTADERVDYVLGSRGVAGAWTREDMRGLLPP
jgi:hypothetical protein